MTRAGAPRVRAVLVTAVLVASAGVLAASDALLPAATSQGWLRDAGWLPAAPAAARQVPAQAVPTVLGCPAPPAVLAVEGTDGQFASQPVATTSRVRLVADAATTGDLRVLAPRRPAAEPVVVADERGALRLAEAAGAEAVRVVGAPRDTESSPATAATFTALTTAGDLRGLAAAPCVPPRAQSWLVGGGVEVGRSTRLVLSNPGATPAVADVTLLRGDGPTLPQAAQDVLVPPGDVVEIGVEGLTGLDPLLAVGVSATGGLLSAVLVDSAVEGLTPAGVEVVVPAEPATSQVLPGVPDAPGTPLSGPGSATLRLAVPGDAQAVVGWRVEGATGPLGGAEPTATTVPAGTVVDVPLEGPVPGGGPAAVVVESDVPVLASVEVSRTGPAPAADVPGAAPTERAWVGPAAALTGSGTLLALPAGPVAAALVLAASPDAGGAGPGTVPVVPVGGDGVERAAVEVTVTPGTTATVGADVLADAVAVRLGASTVPVHAAAVLTASSAPAGPAGTPADLLSVVAVPAAVEPPGDVSLVSAPDGDWP